MIYSQRHLTFSSLRPKSENGYTQASTDGRAAKAVSEVVPSWGWKTWTAIVITTTLVLAVTGVTIAASTGAFDAKSVATPNMPPVSPLRSPPPSPPSPPPLVQAGGSKSKGEGESNGSSQGSITCSAGTDHVGDAALSNSGAALLGAVACVDQAAVAYRNTLDASIAGTDTTTVNIYGPFEAGFTSSVPGLSCLGSNVVDGGIDTYAAELLVQHLCNDNTISILNTCGDHANPRHFHEYKTDCLSSHDPVTHHSTRLGTAADGRGIYGRTMAGDATPALDACGAAYGPTPDSGGASLVHYMAQSNPPFFVGCYTNADATTTVSQCEAMYTGCADAPVTITTAYGSGAYRKWCPCWNSYGSNAGENARPGFWPP